MQTQAPVETSRWDHSHKSGITDPAEFTRVLNKAVDLGYLDTVVYDRKFGGPPAEYVLFVKQPDGGRVMSGAQSEKQQNLYEWLSQLSEDIPFKDSGLWRLIVMARVAADNRTRELLPSKGESPREMLQRFAETRHMSRHSGCDYW